jgi:hypothetical protein
MIVRVGTAVAVGGVAFLVAYQFVTPNVGQSLALAMFATGVVLTVRFLLDFERRLLVVLC